MITIDFLKEIDPSLIALILTPFGAWIGSRLEKGKYDRKLADMDAKLEAQRKSNEATELDNVHKGNQILMEDIVDPLKERINELEQQLKKLQYAISKIYSCAYAPSCPVIGFLQNKTSITNRPAPSRAKATDKKRARAPTATT